MNNWLDIKSDFFARFIRVLGIFMLFIFTSCPIKALIKYNATSPTSTDMASKQSKLITVSEVSCVLDNNEKVLTTSYTNLDVTAVAVLFLFLGFFLLYTVKEKQKKRLHLARYPDSNFLLIFFSRFNL